MRNVTTVLVATTIVAVGGEAAAAAVCGEREMMTQRLAQQYQEHSDSMGLTADGNLLEVYSSDDGTWTVLLVNPKGVACVLAAGEAWEQKDPAERSPEA